MGFIRKISTYFIQLSRYKKYPKDHFNNTSIKKKLLTPNNHLLFPIDIKSKLLNCEMTMSFQEEEQKVVTKGTIINYIQNEEHPLPL